MLSPVATIDLDRETGDRRAALVVAVLALPPAVVVGAIGLLGGWIVALVLFVVVGAGVAGWAWFGADGRVARQLGGEVADPERHARFVNIVEGLCPGVGVAVPRLVVIDDPGLNALAAGRDPHRSVLAVTTGLLGALPPIELEGVVAEELVRIRRRDAVTGTLAASLGGLGRWCNQAADDTAADLRAVSVTRYPPGLAAGLERMEKGGTALRNTSRSLAPLWLADPSGVVPEGSERPGLEARAEALREL